MNYRLVFAILSTATILSFSSVTLPVAEAQSASPYNFSRDLTLGKTGDDVRALQQFLNSRGAPVLTSGPGSPGQETTYFGGATKAALAEWQTSSGISPAVGYFGPISRRTVLLQTGTTATVETIQNVASLKPLDSRLPIRLRIPKINVNAAIEHVGLTPEGAMDAPAGPDGTGWYQFGPRPGENGSAVIAGHSSWKNDIPAVFDDLYKLQPGDKIYVEDGRGVLTTFTVREIRVYNPTADAAEVFSSNDGKSYFNLITCTGTWDNVKRSSSERLVVFTNKE